MPLIQYNTNSLYTKSVKKIFKNAVIPQYSDVKKNTEVLIIVSRI